jgi:hypothetical protein
MGIKGTHSSDPRYPPISPLQWMHYNIMTCNSQLQPDIMLLLLIPPMPSLSIWYCILNARRMGFVKTY